MKKKAFNVFGILLMSFFALATILCVLVFIIDKEMPGNIFYFVVVWAVLFLVLLFEPLYIELDETSITVHFLFGFFEKSDWASVSKIERHISNRIDYQIYGDSYGKKSFFTSLKIPCNRKMRGLLREYWNENFEK